MNDLSFLAGYSAVRARLAAIGAPAPVAVLTPVPLALPKSKPSANPVRAIISEVARKYGAKPELILSDSRIRRVVLARQEIMYRLSTERKMSLPAIGRRLNRDHTTVMHGIKAHVKRGGGHWVKPERKIKVKRTRAVGCKAMLHLLAIDIDKPVAAGRFIAAIYRASVVPQEPERCLRRFASRLRAEGHRIESVYRFGYMLLSEPRAE